MKPQTSRRFELLALGVSALALIGIFMATWAEMSHLPTWAQSVLPTTMPPTRPTVPTETPTPTHTATATSTATVTATVPITVTIPVTPTSTSTPTLTPTNTSTPTPQPAHLPLLYKQLLSLVNGTFTTGSFSPGWETEGTLNKSVVNTERRSPPYAALLGDPSYDNNGGAPVGMAAIAQAFDVPASGHPELHVWYRLHSYDTIQFDYFMIEITEQPNGAPEIVARDGCTTWQPGVKCSKGWEERVISLDPWRGKRVRLRLANVMTNDDGFYNTWTYVDDIYVLCRP
ncbi:MAG: hypothetical protein H5T69_13075 [Chloroflexi bacterium]|nr:hypothetical protein [Chloroflexota bacterium]